MSGLALRVEGLRRVYSADGEDVLALDDLDFELAAGSATAIVGPSGSGKSTLMTILAGLQRPTSGHVFIGESDLTTLTERGLLAIRSGPLSVVVQNAHRNLIPYGTADDNLRFAQRGVARGRQLPDRPELLGQLGLGAVRNVRVDRLSGGERQRVALAAGLATDPSVLLIDEPTSQLDEANRDAIVELLRSINAARGVTIVAVTHDRFVAEQLGQSIAISDGHIEAMTVTR